jgi:hypothetical protein
MVNGSVRAWRFSIFWVKFFYYFPLECCCMLRDAWDLLLQTGLRRRRGAPRRGAVCKNVKLALEMGH